MIKLDSDSLLKLLAEVLADAVYPPACPVCGKALGYETNSMARQHQKIHPWCRQKLVYIEEPKCLRCGKQLLKEDHEFCHNCEKKHHEYTQGAALYAYTDGIKNSIYRFKYKNKREYAAFYGMEMSRVLAEQIQAWEADAIIPVPLHRSKYRARGYNQAELIAAALSTGLKELHGLDLKVDTQLLIRGRKTIPMKKLNDEERAKNLENAFILTNNIVKYKKVILLDDIYTTGATIDACASALKQAGVREVYYVSLCIGKGF